ncbi:MAG: hypothetical protein KGL35_01125 [Bradyrhizobium sp.]|uniref:hypothetical protein n=1 Tax=Bradyrhizobium sp. TaxID=376 RepID=UPI001C2A3D5D|nr:hypothetical protein [Bradyrhizobium sp.]MBU6462346.1 hypothetical protein [Pseudomonadota bacterium]MDE2067400.1 hypothetical protein [Bradyrhizobium sp.]MDE2467369.1 hypothetical protein [Bradyrhizobium sp.]
MTPEDEQPWHSFEPIERYESLFPLLPNYVAHYTIGGKRLPRIGISTKYDLVFRKGLLAALLASRMQIGIAYAEKRYAKDSVESRWLGLTDRIDSIFSEGRKYLDGYLTHGKDKVKSVNDPSQDNLSWQFFFRTLGSLDAAKRLSELGYLCEVATILRSAIEQFAFCSKLLLLEPSEDIKSIRPILCLNHFKKYVPSAGQLYGLLSKYTHFEFDHHTHFFTYSAKEIQTLQRGAVLRAYATQLIFLTMACVSKYILVASPSQFNQVPQSVQDISIFIERVYAFSDDVCTMLPLDEVLSKLDILLQEIVHTK